MGLERPGFGAAPQEMGEDESCGHTEQVRWEHRMDHGGVGQDRVGEIGEDIDEGGQRNGAEKEGRRHVEGPGGWARQFAVPGGVRGGVVDGPDAGDLVEDPFGGRHEPVPERTAEHVADDEVEDGENAGEAGKRRKSQHQRDLRRVSSATMYLGRPLTSSKIRAR